MQLLSARTARTTKTRSSSAPGRRLALLGTVALLLAPDLVTWNHIGNLAISPRIAALLAFAAACLLFGRRGQATKQLYLGGHRLSHQPPTGSRWAYLAMWVVYGLGVVIAAFQLNRPSAILLFALFVIIPYGLGTYLGSDDGRREGALRGFVVGGTILAVWAACEFALGRDLFSPAGNKVLDQASGGFVKANAGYAHALALGMVLSMVLFLAAGYLRRRPALALCVCVAILIGIFATQERSPLIGVAATAVAALVLIRSGRGRAKLVLALVGSIAVLVLIPGAAGASFRHYLLQSTFTGANAGVDVSYRSEILSLGYHAWLTHPWFGLTYGSLSAIQEHATLTQLFTYYGNLYPDVANWPLTLLVETGIVGIVAFGTITLGTLWRLIKRRREMVGDLPFGVLAAALAAGLVTSAGVSSTPSSMLFVYLLGIATGALWAYPREGAVMSLRTAPSKVMRIRPPDRDPHDPPRRRSPVPSSSQRALPSPGGSPPRRLRSTPPMADS